MRQFGHRVVKATYSLDLFNRRSFLNWQKVPMLSPVHSLDEEAFVESESCPEILTREQFMCTPTHSIPILPVLNSMVDKVEGKIDLSNTAIVFAQHLLETTASLIKAIIEVNTSASMRKKQGNILPENIWGIGKIYSSSAVVVKAMRNLGINLLEDGIPETPDGYAKANREAIQKLWKRVSSTISQRGIKKVIVVDDGGRLIEHIPEDLRLSVQMAAVEQTRGGLYSREVNSLLCPLIPVASSAIKKHFLEPYMIAEAIFRAEKTIIDLGITPDKVCGILGNGAIGSAIIDYLLKKNIKVIVYDPDPNVFKQFLGENLYRVNSVEEVIVNASFIFGCVGSHILQSVREETAFKLVDVFSLANRDKTFISTTSEQGEFLMLLRIMTEIFYRTHDSDAKFNPLGDLVSVNCNGRKITIKNMGYPFNFPVRDEKGAWIQAWNVPARDIELTQCAMFTGIIQAALLATKAQSGGQAINQGGRIVSLDAEAQRYIAKLWGAREYKRFTDRYPQDKFDLFDSLEWIKENSSGEFYPCVLSECFKDVPTSIPDNQVMPEESEQI